MRRAGIVNTSDKMMGICLDHGYSTVAVGIMCPVVVPMINVRHQTVTAIILKAIESPFLVVTVTAVVGMTVMIPEMALFIVTMARPHLPHVLEIKPIGVTQQLVVAVA